MAKTEEKTELKTLDDLNVAMKDYNFAKGQVAEAQGRADGSQAALDSHLRDVAKANIDLGTKRDAVRRILANLEKV